MESRTFLRSKILALAARTRRLARVDYASVGIRPQDMPFAPSPAHFRTANDRLNTIDRQIVRRFLHLQRTWRRAPLERVLVDIALVERELDRARRAFGMFFEVFSQRGSTFAPALAAHDVIAFDCYTAVRQAAPQTFRGPLLKPLCYMEHGYSPATMRRGVTLSRLLGEANPFPLIRIPWDRDNPWQTVFLHEVAHNLQADLGIWQENQQAVRRRIMGLTGDPGVTRVYGLWHKEIFADLAGLLLGGPAVAWGMANFLAHPSPRTLTFRPGGAHPTAYLRVHILVEMLRRMGFRREAEKLYRTWEGLYNPVRFNRLPARLMMTSSQVIPHLVDEIAYQTRRNLAHRALADVILFDREDELAIREASRGLEAGRFEVELPPRQWVSAAQYALSTGRTAPRQLSQRVIGHLNERSARPVRTLSEAQAAVAAA